MKIGGVIIQIRKTIYCKSSNLILEQIIYEKTEREIIRILVTLKYLHTILLRHRIIVYMEHKNLIYDNVTTEKVLFWHPLLEEYPPTIQYTRRPVNDIDYSLIKLLFINSNTTERNITRNIYLKDVVSIN